MLIFCENFEIAAVQKDANLVELEKCCRTHIFLQNLVLIQPRMSPPKICKIFEKCIFRKCFAQIQRGDGLLPPRAPEQVRGNLPFEELCTEVPVGMVRLSCLREKSENRNALPKFRGMLLQTCFGSFLRATHAPNVGTDASALSKLNRWRLLKLIKIK